MRGYETVENISEEGYIVVILQMKNWKIIMSA